MAVKTIVQKYLMNLWVAISDIQVTRYGHVREQHVAQVEKEREALKVGAGSTAAKAA